MNPSVANVGHVVQCVNCGHTASVPDPIFDIVALFICGRPECENRYVVVEVFDRIGLSV